MDLVPAVLWKGGEALRRWGAKGGVAQSLRVKPSRRIGSGGCLFLLLWRLLLEMHGLSWGAMGAISLLSYVGFVNVHKVQW